MKTNNLIDKATAIFKDVMFKPLTTLELTDKLSRKEIRKLERLNIVEKVQIATESGQTINKYYWNTNDDTDNSRQQDNSC